MLKVVIDKRNYNWLTLINPNLESMSGEEMIFPKGTWRSNEEGNFCYQEGRGSQAWQVGGQVSHPCICCGGLEKALPTHCLLAQAPSAYTSICPRGCCLTSLHDIWAPFPTGPPSEPVGQGTSYFSWWSSKLPPLVNLTVQEPPSCPAPGEALPCFRTTRVIQ